MDFTQAMIFPAQ
jgi:hypothetical protein